MSDKRPRIVVAVDPRLLGDVLSIALSHDGIEVVDTSLVVDLPEVERHFLVALVSTRLPRGTTAEIVIRLPDPRVTPTSGYVLRAGREEPVDLLDLNAVIDLVDRFVTTGA